MRRVVLLVVVALLTVSAAPPRRTSDIAPEIVPHSFALFLGTLSTNGTRQVTFRARAEGLRFFFEEHTGVTVYRFSNGNYRREEFLRAYSLEQAIKRYAKS